TASPMSSCASCEDHRAVTHRSQICRRWPHPVAALIAVTLTSLLTACSSEDNARGGPVVAGPSPATEARTTAATTVAAVTVGPTQPSTPPAAAATVAPPAAPTTVATTAASTRPASSTYAPTLAPQFPDRSAPPPAGNGLPDGTY